MASQTMKGKHKMLKGIQFSVYNVAKVDIRTPRLAHIFLQKYFLMLEIHPYIQTNVTYLTVAGHVFKHRARKRIYLGSQDFQHVFI